MSADTYELVNPKVGRVGRGKAKHILIQIVEGSRYHALCGTNQRYYANTVQDYGDGSGLTCQRCKQLLDSGLYAVVSKQYTQNGIAVVSGERIIWQSLGGQYKDKMVEILNDELPNFETSPYIATGRTVWQRGRIVFEGDDTYDLRFIHTLTTILNFERAWHRGQDEAKS